MMNLEQIEAALGRNLVAAIGVAVEDAYVRSRQTEEGRLALSQLLIAHLATVVAVAGNTDNNVSNRATYCAELLISIVEEIKNIEVLPDTMVVSERTPNRTSETTALIV